MKSKIKTYTFSDDTCQRVQTVTLNSWDSLDFWKGQGAGEITPFAQIFRQYLIPACPWLFGSLVLFSLPEGMAVPFSRETKYGRVADPLTAAAAGLQAGVTIVRGKPRFRDPVTEDFWNRLEKENRIQIVSGKNPLTTIIPVGNAPAFLSEGAESLRVNASFFIMDPFDCATVFDHVGVCIGLMVKDGCITNPPLYDREALLVRKNGTVAVEHWDIRDLPIQIGERVFRHGENAQVHTRPRHPVVAGRGEKLVIVGNRVAAVTKGMAHVPASGYVLCPQEEMNIQPGEEVSYPAMEDVAFGVQVGNSILKDGIVTEKFHSKFYHIRHLEPVPYPPSLYPMDFQRSRAARIALGSDGAGRPMLLWAEGAPKLGYQPGKHSRGASLADMGRFCRDAGMVQAVNLDGGGSAQMLLHGNRTLEISDRNPDHTQSERPVPNGLMVK